MKAHLIGAIFLALHGGACGPPPASESLEGIDKSCDEYCETLLYCPYNQVPGDSEEDLLARVEQCSQSCSSDAEQGASIGDLCAQSYGAAIRCLETLNCDEHRFSGMPEYPCKAEYDSVIRDCPGVWQNTDG